MGAENIWAIGSWWIDWAAIGRRGCSDNNSPWVVLFGWLWFLSGAYRVVSDKGWSLANAIHCMPFSGGGEGETAFIGQVLLSLVAREIRATVVRSS